MSSIKLDNYRASQLLMVGVMQATLMRDFSFVNSLLDEMDTDALRQFQRLIGNLNEAIESHSRERD
ncbi:hypothetical protein [Streptomyces sp. 5-10]|uniref:hypothetical protein n=1 Tax=Streptomyces sp. 5-10 TaxID=878925 RepID=UPI00168A9DE5|nr:hypothetical protein [Streptomyces sp. 5-10]MBD3004659.1 hypothetical protein [Streptomyces sp. 5-10]